MFWLYNSSHLVHPLFHKDKHKNELSFHWFCRKMLQMKESGKILEKSHKRGKSPQNQLAANVIQMCPYCFKKMSKNLKKGEKCTWIKLPVNLVWFYTNTVFYIYPMRFIEFVNRPMRFQYLHIPLPFHFNTFHVLKINSLPTTIGF